MSDEEKKQENTSGDQTTDKAKEMIEKGKDLADKAEDFFEEKVNKVKSSEAFGKITDLLGKVESFMEEKSEQFHSGAMEAKIEAFKARAEVQADELLNRAKEAGVKIGDSVDQTIDILKGKKNPPSNQSGEGI